MSVFWAFSLVKGPFLADIKSMVKRYINRSHMLSLLILIALTSFPLGPVLSASGATILPAQYTTWDGWSKFVGTTGDSVITPKVLVDGEGDVYISGGFKSDGFDFDPGSGEDLHESSSTGLFLTKYTSTGSYLWTKSWASTDGGDVTPSPTPFIISPNGSITLIGSIHGSNPNSTVENQLPSTLDLNPGSGTTTLTVPHTEYKFFMIQVSSDGTFNWGHETSYASDLDVLSNGNLIASEINSMKIYSPLGVLLKTVTNLAINYGKVVVDHDDTIHILADYNSGVVFVPNEPQTNIEFPDNNGQYPDARSVLMNFDSEGDYLGVDNLGIYSKYQPNLSHTANCCARMVIRDIEVDSENNIYATGFSLGNIGVDPNPGPADPIPDLDQNGNFIYGSYDYAQDGNIPFMLRVNNDGTLGNFTKIGDGEYFAIPEMLVNHNDQVMALTIAGITTYSSSGILDDELVTENFINFLDEFSYQASSIAVGPNGELYTSGQPSYYSNPYTGEMSPPDAQLFLTGWGTPTVHNEPINIVLSDVAYNYQLDGNNDLHPGETAFFDMKVHTTTSPELFDSLTFNFSNSEYFTVDSVTPSRGTFDVETSTWTSDEPLGANEEITFSVSVTASRSGAGLMGTFAAELVSAHLEDGVLELNESSTLSGSATYAILDASELCLQLSVPAIYESVVDSDASALISLTNCSNHGADTDEIHFDVSGSGIDIDNIETAENPEDPGSTDATDMGSYNNTTSTWTGTLKPQETISFEITGHITGNAGDYFTFTPTITTGSIEGIEYVFNESSILSETGTGYINFPETDLGLVSQFTPGKISQGQSVNINTSVHNNGPETTAYNDNHTFGMLYLLPPELQYESYTSNSLYCVHIGGTSSLGPGFGDYMNLFVPGYSVLMCGTLPTNGSNVQFGTEDVLDLTVTGTALSDFVTSQTSMYAILMANNILESDSDELGQLAVNGTDFRNYPSNNINSLTYSFEDIDHPDEETTTTTTPETTTTTPATTPRTTHSTAATSPTTSPETSPTVQPPTTKKGSVAAKPGASVNNPNVAPVVVRDEKQNREETPLVKSIINKAVAAPGLVLGIFSLTGSNAWDTVILAFIILIIGFTVYLISQESKKTKALNKRSKF